MKSSPRTRSLAAALSALAASVALLSAVVLMASGSIDRPVLKIGLSVVAVLLVAAVGAVLAIIVKTQGQDVGQ